MCGVIKEEMNKNYKYVWMNIAYSMFLKSGALSRIQQSLIYVVFYIFNVRTSDVYQKPYKLIKIH